MVEALRWDDTRAAGCTLDRQGNAVVLSAGPEGGHAVFEGPAGAVGGAAWHPSRFLVLDALDHEAWTMGVVFRLWAADGVSAGDVSERPDMQITMGLIPRLLTRLSLPLAALDSQTMFMPRTPGKLKTVITGQRLDPAQIVRLELGVMPAHAGQTVTITGLRMTDAEPDYPVPDVTLVDEMGQYTRREWPGKTRSVDELVTYLRQEHAAAREDGFGRRAARVPLPEPVRRVDRQVVRRDRVLPHPPRRHALVARRPAGRPLLLHRP